MARRVQAKPGQRGVTLPGGWSLDGGDEVVIPDDEWTQVQRDGETLGRLADLGSTSDPAPVPPTWRDIQKAVAALLTPG